MRLMLAQKPTTKARLVVSAGAPVTTAAWVEVVAALTASACAIEILNTTGRLLILATGQAGSENELPFYVMPSAEPKLFPIENVGAGGRIAVRAVDGDADTDGQIIINLYG